MVVASWGEPLPTLQSTFLCHLSNRANDTHSEGYAIQYNQICTLIYDLEYSVMTSARWDRCRMEHEMTVSGRRGASIKTTKMPRIDVDGQ